MLFVKDGACFVNTAVEDRLLFTELIVGLYMPRHEQFAQPLARLSQLVGGAEVDIVAEFGLQTKWVDELDKQARREVD